MTEKNTAEATTVQAGPITRSRRLRKKLHLDEFAILGFEFTCKITADDNGSYDPFFDDFSEVVTTRDLYINLDGDENYFVGFVTSAERYGNATEEDRSAVEAALTAHAMVSDVKVDRLVDAYYEL